MGLFSVSPDGGEPERVPRGSFAAPPVAPSAALAPIAALLLVASQYHLWSRLSSGSVFAPEFPRPVVLLFHWAFGALALAAVLPLALDLVALISLALPGGGWAIPTMATCMQLLPKGFEGSAYRSTDGTIFVCIEGKGSTQLEDKKLEWGPNDVFVIPPWKRYTHHASDESVLFSISDLPAQQALGIWREGK